MIPFKQAVLPRKTVPLIVISFLTLPALAGCMTIGPVETVEVTATPTPTEAPTPTVAGTPLPTPTAAAVGAFSVGHPLPVSSLRQLDVPDVQIGLASCDLVTLDQVIELLDVSSEIKALCIYNVPVGLESPPLTLTLTSPDGQTYVDAFNFLPTPIGIQATSSTSGQIAFVDTSTEQPHIQISLSFPADLPAGDWQANITTLDGALALDVPITVNRNQGVVSLRTNQRANPFVLPEAIVAAAGDVVTLTGSGFQPNTVLLVALYQSRSEFALSVQPFDAVLLNTDIDGRFSVDYELPAEAPAGMYFVAASPNVAGLALDPLASSFSVVESPTAGETPDGLDLLDELFPEQ